MVTSIVFIVLIGTFQFNFAISAAINYEPIKITVNENFNAQPRPVSPELQSLVPAVDHQSANFYFKPQLNLPPSYIPSHIEALISLVQQNHHSCANDTSKVVVEKDKLIEILKPFMYPMSDISKEKMSEIVFEKGNNLEIVTPIIITEEPKPVTPKLVFIPEAPVLSLLSFNGIPPVVKEEVKKEDSIMLEEPTGVFPKIPEIVVRPITEPIINYVEPKSITSGLVVIPEAPVLPTLSANDIHIVEDELKIEEPIVVDVEPKPDIQELVAIPEAPVLPSLSLHDTSSIIEEKMKKHESIIFEKPTGVYATIREPAVKTSLESIINYVESKPITSELEVTPEVPILPPRSYNGIPPIVGEEVKKQESKIVEELADVLPEATIIELEPKPITSELVGIPEAPVLSPKSFNGIPPIVEEEVKKEESIILEKPTGEFPTISKIAMRPNMEPIINNVEPKPITPGVVAIPEAPVLPTLSANDIRVVVDVVPKPAIQEPVAIPEAPEIPSLSLHDISSIVEEEVKKEEGIILDVPTGVFPTIPELAIKPIPEPIINYVEPKHITSETLVVPEAPVLPLLSFNGIPPVVDDEMKKEELITLVEPTAVFPTIPEIAMRPIPEPVINYVESKPITSKYVVIPDAPILPPLSYNGMPPIVEEVKNEESIIVGESAGILPEPTIIEVEPKPNTLELEVIPEAPVLHSLSVHEISSIIEKEVKKEESVKLEEATSVFPSITEIAARPTVEPIINYVKPKPIIQKLVAMHDISSIVEEEVKKEEVTIREEPTGVFPTIPEKAVRPITEPFINYVEPKPELVLIPEAPVLPPLSAKDNHEVKIEEPTIVDVEPKPITSELVVIPEAPVLPPLSYNGIPPVVEEETEKSIKVEESTDVFPSIPEITARPFPEPLVSETAESFALENNIFPVATKEVKIEIPILLEESIEVFPPIAEISSGTFLQESSPEITDSYVLEEVSQPNPESVVTINETLPPTIISNPSNHLGVFSYVPFVSHLSKNVPKTEKNMIPKPASLERFLLKKRPFRLPVTPFPKLDLNAIKSSTWGNKKQFLYPTSYAHDVVEKRIAPNMEFKQQNAPKRVKIYIRSKVPKGPSNL